MSNTVFLSYASYFHIFYNHSYHKVWWKSFDAFLTDANIVVSFIYSNFWIWTGNIDFRFANTDTFKIECI